MSFGERFEVEEVTAQKAVAFDAARGRHRVDGGGGGEQPVVAGARGIPRLGRHDTDRAVQKIRLDRVIVVAFGCAVTSRR